MSCENDSVPAVFEMRGRVIQLEWMHLKGVAMVSPVVGVLSTPAPRRTHANQIVLDVDLCHRSAILRPQGRNRIPTISRNGNARDDFFYDGQPLPWDACTAAPRNGGPNTLRPKMIAIVGAADRLTRSLSSALPETRRWTSTSDLIHIRG